MLWVPEGSFILVSCTNFASDHLLCGPVVNHRLIPINVPESADLCPVWPVCGCWGIAVLLCFSGLEWSCSQKRQPNWPALRMNKPPTEGRRKRRAQSEGRYHLSGAALVVTSLEGWDWVCSCSLVSVSWSRP